MITMRIALNRWNVCLNQWLKFCEYAEADYHKTKDFILKGFYLKLLPVQGPIL